jgi:prepilin-type processing-associated H-X9-DG protein
MYINDNKGKFPAVFISKGDPNAYNDGWFWAAELVHLKYIYAPNIYRTVGSTAKTFDQPSVFLCPEGLTPEEWGTSGSGNSGSNQGNWPTDAKNNGFVYGGLANPRSDGQPAYDVASWYQLNARISGYPSNYTNTGTNNPPFIFFDSSKNSTATPPTMVGQLADPGYTRSLAVIKKSSVMVMLGEAANVNWASNGANAAGTAPGGYICNQPRLGARHGQLSTNKCNAYTNFAFFDGHVALFPTQPIEDLTVNGKVGNLAMYPASGTVFVLCNQ